MILTDIETLPRTELGRTGIEVSRLCLGGNVFGWNLDRESSFAVLDAFLAAGGDFIDTADVYSVWSRGNAGGESEAIIGDWIRSRGLAGRVRIATKVGMAMGDGSSGLGREHIVRSAEASLRRLGVDVIDVYYAHRDDETTSLEETMSGFDDLVRDGKVRALGASNFSDERLAESLAVSVIYGLARFEVLQPPYNLAQRGDLEGQLQQVCVEEQISIVPYYGLASGFLTGKYRPDSTDSVESVRAAGVLQRYGNADGWRLLDAIDAVAARHEATPAQIALAWLARRAAVAAPIASATSPAQLAEIIGAFSVKLSRADVEDLDVASMPFT